MEMFKFSVSAAIAFLLMTCICDAEQTSPKTTDKTRRDDSDSESTDSDEGTAPTSVAPATVSYTSFRMPPFRFAPVHPHYPPPPMFSQIPPPPMMMPNHHHHPYPMMPAASSFTAFYRPLPPPPHPMMSARMSLHPMHPLTPPFMHGPRTMLPVMVPIKRWDEQTSLFDSLMNSEAGLDNAFLDEPLVFDEEELLAARRHIPSPPPPPAHRRDSFDPYPTRQSYQRSHVYESRDRDAYEPIPSENRYDGPSERMYKHEREYDDRHERHGHHDRHSLRHFAGTSSSPAFEAYDDHTPQEANHSVNHAEKQEQQPPASLDEYHQDP